jgi:predicted MFS family arabinose efflux permease
LDHPDKFSIFLFTGLVTVITAPFLYWKVENDITTARFLNRKERSQAIERLRANQTGTGTNEFKWDHISELVLEPKTYLFIGMTLLLNIGAQVSNTFGPLILAGIGFDKYKTSLLNIPFGVLQFLTILLGSWAAAKCRLKSIVLAAFMIPVVIGIALLYALPRTGSEEAPLMVGFYLFSFLFAGNPLIVSWMIGNTAGTTKKSVLLACYQGASSAGNIIGPLLFTSEDAPSYHPGLRAVLGIFVALVGIVFVQLANLIFLNKLQQRKRVRNGKSAVIKDHSMEDRYIGYEAGEEGYGERAFLDITDRKNDEFTYIY